MTTTATTILLLVREPWSFGPATVLLCMAGAVVVLVGAVAAAVAPGVVGHLHLLLVCAVRGCCVVVLVCCGALSWSKQRKHTYDRSCHR